MTKEVTPLVSEDLKKGDLVRWKKYKAMLGFVISPEPTYVGSIAIAVTPSDGYHDARTFATPDELEVIDLNALEADRSALLREVEKLKEATRWIPVSERLPEETFTGLVPSTLVLCFGKGGRWFTAIFADGYFADVDGNDCDFVTHWMPLPTPPEP